MLFLVLTSVTSASSVHHRHPGRRFESSRHTVLIITHDVSAGASIQSTCSRLLADGLAFNPVVYLVSGFRWSFYGLADVSVGLRSP